MKFIPLSFLSLTLLLVLFVFNVCVGVANEPEVTPLWTGRAPEALGDADNDRPSLLKFVAAGENATRAAIVILPGGGYGHLAMGHEGKQIAEWLNKNGIHAFVCDYRHRGKGYGHPAPMLDAQRAIRTVRANAKRLGVRPDRIGVLGFSAGGHLASTVATQFDAGKPDSSDAIERVSSRPDFAILCYPVIAMGEPYSHKGSQRNLLGKDASPELLQSMSNHEHVTKETPPTFLWHTTKDAVVPAKNSIVFFEALLAAEVPAELHVYLEGGHGMGLAKEKHGARNWPAQCLSWLEGQKLVDQK